MKAYQISDGDSLAVSIDGRVWETITFNAKDFQDIRSATAEELANVINRSGALAASADEQGTLVLATSSSGGHTSLEIDAAQSTAAAALGLVGGHTVAYGEGLRAARLVSLSAEPYSLPLGAEMSITVDGHKRRIVFGEGITKGKATADEVAKIINAKRKRIADVTREGRVMFTSTTVGAGSNLGVDPGPSDEGKVDAAALLGFIGRAAFDQPHAVAPARLVCRGPQIGLQVVNLTASPIELHLSTTTSLLPSRGCLPLTADEASSSQLQRLIEQGMVRLMPGTGD